MLGGRVIIGRVCGGRMGVQWGRGVEVEEAREVISVTPDQATFILQSRSSLLNVKLGLEVGV